MILSLTHIMTLGVAIHWRICHCNRLLEFLKRNFKACQVIPSTHKHVVSIALFQILFSLPGFAISLDVAGSELSALTRQLISMSNLQKNPLFSGIHCLTKTISCIFNTVYILRAKTRHPIINFISFNTPNLNQSIHFVKFGIFLS